MLGDVALGVGGGDGIEGCLGVEGVLGVEDKGMISEGSLITNWEHLDVGDTVLGVDLRNINVNNPELDKIAKERIPDIILVKKLSDEENSDDLRIRKSLSHLEGFPAVEAGSSDLQNLLQDLMNISE